MAKQYYTSEETQSKLGMTQDEIKQLVRDGQLREFRDAGQIRYKAEEVDGLAENLETLSGSLGGTTGELVLEPSDETSMGLTGSDMLTLDEAERTDSDTGGVDDKKEDTVITSVGISVFDDEDVIEADPGAQTVMAEKDRSEESGTLSLESLSSKTGSGLLDLTREADDTSLGAELLDEIYTEDQEAGMPEMGDATRAGLEAVSEDEPRPREEIFERPVGAPQEEEPTVAAVSPQYGSVVMVQQGEVGPVELGLTWAMLGAIISLVIAGIAIAAHLQDVVPALIEVLQNNILVVLGSLAGLTGILFGIGYYMGKKG